MSEYEIETIPLISEMGTPPTLGDTDNFDQDAEAYLYSQRQAFLDLNATIAVLNPVAAAIMQQAQVVASNTSSVQQLANQVSQQANQVSQDTATVNQQAQTVADLRQQVAEDAATVQQHLAAAQQAATQAEAIIGFNPAELTGQVAYFAMTTPPNGWLKANGAALSRSTYAALFAAIGTTFGNGDGSTTFNLPDLRGQFLRAWDDGKDIDSGRDFGSSQSDDNKAHSHSATSSSAGSHSHTGSTSSSGSHSHTMTFENPDGSSTVYPRAGVALQMEYSLYGNDDVKSTSASGSHTHSISINTGGSHSHSISIGQSGGSESRPKNVALLACIRY